MSVAEHGEPPERERAPLRLWNPRPWDPARGRGQALFLVSEPVLEDELLAPSEVLVLPLSPELVEDDELSEDEPLDEAPSDDESEEELSDDVELDGFPLLA